MSIPNTDRLRPAPRDIPFLLRCQLLFGGMLSQLGWLFFGFGMIFIWVLIPDSDWQSLQYIGTAREHSEATVMQVSATNLSEGGSKSRRGRTIYAYRYEFIKDKAVLYEGVSYSSRVSLRYGEKIPVEYPRGNPQASRIEGLRSAPFNLLPLFIVMIFPGIGLFFVISSIRSGIRSIRILGNGNLGYGKLESMTYTNTKINDKPVAKMIFRFMGPAGVRYEVKSLTENPGLLQDDEKEQLLYDRYHPNEAVMLDTLPGGIMIDNGGNIKSRKISYPLGVILIPLIVTSANVAYIGYLLFG